MTEKRFYLMNVEDPLHEYGRWCKPVLEDGKTGKQYEKALEVMDLLNELNDEKKEVSKNFYRFYEEDYCNLEKENKQLKSENQELRQYLSWQNMELEEMEDLND